MKKTILALLVLRTVVLLGTDRDTLPLNQRQTGGGEQDGFLTQPAKTTFENHNKKLEVGDAQKEVPPDSKALPYVASIDTFGSSRIDEASLRETLGPEMDTWLSSGLRGDPTAGSTQAKMTEKIKAKFGFPVVDWSLVQYFEPGDMAVHVTLDVVEKEDVARRMPFFAPPTQTFADPDGLIQAWLEYEKTALDLVRRGKLEPESDRCQALHCPFGHKHPSLKKYEGIFFRGVKKNVAKLLEIQTKDQRPDFRASATYLLAYWKDGKKVVDAMLGSIRDPDPLVRNNALRVLGDIAEFHTDLLIPVQPLLQALQFPRVSDRSKSLYAVYLLAVNSQTVREEITRTSVPTLLAFLSSKQPDHRDVSHTILRKISGKEFPGSDLRAWTAWYNRISKERRPSNQLSSP